MHLCTKIAFWKFLSFQWLKTFLLKRNYTKLFKESADETKCEQPEAWKKIITTSNIRPFDPRQILEHRNFSKENEANLKKYFHRRILKGNRTTLVFLIRRLLYFLFSSMTTTVRSRRSFSEISIEARVGPNRVEKAPNKRPLRVVTFSEWGTTEEGRSPIVDRNKRKDNPARTRRRTPA